LYVAIFIRCPNTLLSNLTLFPFRPVSWDDNPRREVMVVCDLCGQAKECLAKIIEGKEYDVCSECWNPLAEKLRGKGRVTKDQETVFLPPSRVKERKDQGPKPLPGEPPKIWGRTGPTDSLGIETNKRQRR
jgi:hypothetical protein